MAVERFGSVEGTEVLQITLGHEVGLRAKVLTWGAILRDLVVPAPAGPRSVVLGLNSIEDYVAHSPYFGAVVGRYANRIDQARFTLHGRTYQLDANENGRNQLHGGSRGFASRHWTLAEHGPSHAVLTLLSADGDMGYPGRLAATCTYSLVDAATLRIRLEATADRATPVNLSTHGYFNLDGRDDIRSHSLSIAANSITPTDANLIPTGEIRSVNETAYDFRLPRPLCASQARETNYDVNYVLLGRAGSLEHAATLTAHDSGLAMELWTTEPGLQFYDGHLLALTVPGLDGRFYGRNAGLCLEPQRFPDGPNKPNFPNSILEPGQISRQITELRFTAR